MMIRWFLWLFLLGVFLWQTHISINKYLMRHTSITFKHSNPDRQEFPSISICSMESESMLYVPSYAELTGDGKTFSEAMRDRSRTNYLDWYKPAGSDKQFFRLNRSTLPDDWRKYYTLSPLNGLAECFTYSTTELIKPGYKSQFVAILRGTFRKLKTVILINMPNQTLLVPNRMYSTNYLTLPTLIGDDGFGLYEITTTEHKRVANSDVPCHEENNFSISQCIQTHFQSSRRCLLPWQDVIVNDSTPKRECSTAEDWQSYLDEVNFLLHTSEKEIYERTGCYFNCRFKTYDIKAIVEEKNEPYSQYSTNELQLWIYLATNGINVEKEILIYDMDDLVGNIGGFLGLFLGASILSMYDSVREGLSKLCY